jgi:hypothetical protein
MSNPLMQFHKDMIETYCTCWADEEARIERGVSRAEAAYNFLAHIAQMVRFCDNREHWPTLIALLALDATERRDLTLTACAFIETICLEESVRLLYENEAFEIEQVEYLTTILIQRDVLECALAMVKELSKDLWQADPEVSSARASACCRAAAIDDVLLTRPDALAAASPGLAGLKDQFKVQYDECAFWWFDYVPASARGSAISAECADAWRAQEAEEAEWERLLESSQTI